MSNQIIITGVESSGKTTLSQRLAEFTQWPLIPEHARTDPAVLNGQHGPGDLERLMFEQESNARQHAANGPVLCDTGAIVLSLWSEVRFGVSLPGAREVAQRAGLYLLCEPDLLWEPDPLRDMPDLKERLALHEQYKERLTAWELPHVPIRGNALEGRFQQAILAIQKAGFNLSV